MPGIAQLALGSAPILGGALVGVAAGQFKAPDFRDAIKADLDLLARLPEEQATRRAALQGIIVRRIADLVEANVRTRRLRAAAGSYEGDWRDIVLFICAVLFTVIWWNVNHQRTNWLPMFVVLIVVSVLAGLYAIRGLRRGVRRALRRRSR